MGIKKTIEVDVDLTPEDLAKLFCDMQSDGQAKFFNEVAAIPIRDDWQFCMQLAWITGEEVLTKEARSLMSDIGEYADYSGDSVSVTVQEVVE